VGCDFFSISDLLTRRPLSTNWTVTTMSIVNLVTRVQVFDNTACAAYSSSECHHALFVAFFADPSRRLSWDRHCARHV
jgi:hypothetical protein